MAKIYDYKGEQQQWVILEDPRVSNDGLYLFDYKHDFATLSPIYNKKHATTGSNSNNYLVNNNKSTLNTSSYQISLTKDWVGFDNYTSTSSTYFGNIYQQKFWMSMDRNFKAKEGVFTMNNGVSDAVFQSYTTSETENSNMSLISYGIEESADLSDIAYRGGVTGSPQTTGFVRPGNTSFWLYYYSVGNQLGGLHRKYITSNSWYSDRITIGNSISWPTVQSITLGYTFIAYYSTSFLGLSSVDSQPLFIQTNSYSTSQPYRAIIVRATGSAQTTMTNLTTGISMTAANRGAGGLDVNGLTSDGTTSGGEFANTTNKVCTRPSRTMTDPRDGTGNTKLWYSIYIDDNSDYHPDLWTWNTVDDTFTQQTDVQMQAGAGQTPGFTGKSSGVDAWNSTGIGALSAGLFLPTNSQAGTGALTHHLFEFAGERYITLIIVDASRAYSTNQLVKTLLTWKIDAANPRLFTFHSKYVLPFPWQSHIFLNDEETLIGLNDDYSFLIIAFNAATGWESANTLSYKISSIGRDSTDRIWYTKDSSSFNSTNYPELHLLTPSLPLTVTVVPAATSYTYAGSQIASTVAVNAYNAQGDRISTDVKLLIEGTGMTFTGGTTITTITTSAADPIDVDIFINSAGFSNITASVDI